MIDPALDPTLVGLNGWYRFGKWSAHFYVDGVKQCNIRHQYREAGIARGLPPTSPIAAEISRHGVPFGRSCTYCARSTPALEAKLAFAIERTKERKTT